jgi:hypothetical protein
MAWKVFPIAAVPVGELRTDQEKADPDDDSYLRNVPRDPTRLFDLGCHSFAHL